MRAVVVYESMYGNTRQVAEAIAEGFGSTDTVVLPVATADASAIEGAELLVVGAPTHAFGLSRPKTRAAAADAAHKQGSGLVLEPGATGPGVREWLASLAPPTTRLAAFDTRMTGAGMLGRAGRTMRRTLRRRGMELVVPAESFLVGKNNRLRPGELERARRWGSALEKRLLDLRAASQRD